MVDVLVGALPLLCVVLGAVLLCVVLGAVLLRRGVRTRISPQRSGALAVLVGVVALTALIAPFLGVDPVFRTLGPAAFAWGAFAFGAATSLSLATAVAIGDRSRGRPRCPSCWYDMSGARTSSPSALICPECGHNIRRDRRLFCTRRPRSLVVASLVPLALSASGFGVWLASQPDWTKATPTAVLSILSPWSDFSGALRTEVRDRIRDQSPEHERTLQACASHFALWIRSDPDAVLFHATILDSIGLANGDTTTAVISVLLSSDPEVTAKAAELLGRLPHPSADHTTEAALVEALNDPDARERAVNGLCYLKLDHRGGAVPLALLTLAQSSNVTPQSLNLLGLYEPTKQSRDLLIRVARTASGWTAASAVSALTNLYPYDTEVQSLVIAELAKPAPDNPDLSMISLLRWHDLSAGRTGPDAVARRRDLYSAPVRHAIIDTLTASHASPALARFATIEWWPVANEAFTREERAELQRLLNRNGTGNE
jgi:hypothetical protein